MTIYPKSVSLRHMLNWNDLPRPIAALSPMADMTDRPFCLICKQRGATIMFREMVSSEAIVRQSSKTLKMCEFDDCERPLIQQIFGSDPAIMAEAARLIEEKFHPDGFDINMGCPVYNLVSNFNGAFLIKEPERAAAIIKAVKAVIHVPLSVKTRLGWKDDTDALEFVKVIEDSGADLISIHGRTKEQGYSGQANWKMIGQAKKNTRLPVLVNGDITDLESARTALDQSQADGVLIGRGALGNPWIFDRLIKGLREGIDPGAPTVEERLSTIREHARLQIEYHGQNGLIKLRKHLPWYFKNQVGLKDLRSKLVRVTTLGDLDEALKVVLN